MAVFLEGGKLLWCSQTPEQNLEGSHKDVGSQGSISTVTSKNQLPKTDPVVSPCCVPIQQEYLKFCVSGCALLTLALPPECFNTLNIHTHIYTYMYRETVIKKHDIRLRR